MTFHKGLIWVLILSSRCFVPNASADDFEWIGGADDWSILDNWMDLDNPDGSNPPDYAAVNLPGPSDTVYISNGGTPVISGNSSANTVTVDQDSSLGISDGLLNVEGGYEIVGSSSTGVVTQSAGSNMGSSLYLGENSGADGMYDFSAGLVNFTYESVGDEGSGTFTQSGGGNGAGYGIWIGDGATGFGYYNLSGGNIIASGVEYVGYSGNGTLTQTDGTNAITGTVGVTQEGNLLSGQLRLGNNAGSVGTYNLGDANLSVISFESVGFFGAGTFNQSGGLNSASYGIWIGDAPPGIGNYNLSDGCLSISGVEYVGFSGNGTLTQTGGTNEITGTVGITQVGGLISGQLRLGNNAGSVGTYNLKNNAVLFVNSFESVGFLGSGTFNQSGGINRATYGLWVGDGASGIGTYNLSGGILEVQTNEYIGFNGNGTLLQSGGTQNVANLFVGANSGSRGLFEINGGSLTVSGSLNIDSEGTLSGSGSVSGTVINGGAVSPGNPFGKLTLIGNYTQSASGTLNIEIDGPSAGSQYNQLGITGSASLNGTLKIAFSNGYVPQIGDEIPILTSSSLTGTFATISIATDANGLTMVPVYSSTGVVLVATSPTLSVADANPLFLPSVMLPQPITPGLLQTLATDSTTRNSAAADGITQLLLQFTNDVPGTVVFSTNGAPGGTLTAVDGSPLPTSGMHTIAIGDTQVAFALYTVPDTITPGQTVVTLQSSFIPDGSSTSIQQTPWNVSLIQTPVVLVHGLWGASSDWDWMEPLLENNNIWWEAVNYHDKSSAAGPFSQYSGTVLEKVIQTINDLRTNFKISDTGVAVTRADVVAHSMGGILTRMDANSQGNKELENFNMGYIRRVVTIDTPHWGSCAAPVLSLLANEVPWFNIALSISGHPVVNEGAVQDLVPSSFAINSGGANGAACEALPATVPCYAISGYVQQDGNFSGPLSTLYKSAFLASSTLGESQQDYLQNLMCGQFFATSDDMSMSGDMFLGQLSDGVVAEASQNGNCASFRPFGGIEHTVAPMNLTILNYSIGLLQGPASAFGNGFPAVTPADLNSQICRSSLTSLAIATHPEPLLQMRLITLTAPTSGSTVSSGSSFTVMVQPLTNVVLQLMSIIVSGNNPAYNQNFAWDILTNAPFAEVIAAPTNYFGPLTVTAIGVDNQGNYDTEQSVINVLPGTNLALESIAVNLNSAGTNLTFSELDVPQGLDVVGIYSDGVSRDITLAGVGTVYNTSAPKVAVVDANGNVSAVGNGSAQITVRNGGLSTQISVQVSLKFPEIMSITPNSFTAGASNVNLSLVGMNLGGASNVTFLRNGSPDSHLTVGNLVVGANAANIQISTSASSSTPAGTLTVVITTPVGNSEQVATQGNQLSIVASPVQSFTNIYEFTSPIYSSGLGVSTNSDGFSPRSDLVESGGTLYGTASEGGSAGNGTVFKVNNNGTGFTNLHSFTTGFGSFPEITNTDGAWPVAGLILGGNTLYGTTESGGSSGSGSVFKINSDGTGFTNLHSFTATSEVNPTNSDGAWPQAGLVLSGSTLFGTAEYGGSFGSGIVFAINTNGTSFTNLHSFTGGSDGAYPVAGLALAGNTLYGTAYEGGRLDAGVVFAVNTNGTGFTNLYSFTDGSDGAGPQAGLVLSGNMLYGTASQGGSSDNGTVFAVNANGTGFTNLYSFTGVSDGADPVAGLSLSGNTLYGTAEEGGTSGYGTVFTLNANGTGFVALHSFAGYSGDGAYPMGGLTLSGSILYGSAESGGSSDYGTLYSLSLLPASQTQLNIIASGQSIILTWPAIVTGCTLQSTTNLASPTAWTTVTPTPVVVNGQNTVTNAISVRQMYYRLSQ